MTFIKPDTRAVIEACSRSILSCLSSSCLILFRATFNSCVNGHDSLLSRSSLEFSLMESQLLQVSSELDELRLPGETGDWTENLSVYTLLLFSSLSLQFQLSDGKRCSQGFLLKFRTCFLITLLKNCVLRGILCSIVEVIGIWL